MESGENPGLHGKMRLHLRCQKMRRHKGLMVWRSQSFGSFLWDCRLIVKVGWKDEVWTKMRQEYRVRRLEEVREMNCTGLSRVMDEAVVGEQNSGIGSVK